MTSRWINRNTIEIPATAQSEGTIGDGMIRIDPDDPRWEVWSTWLIQQGHKRPR